LPTTDSQIEICCAWNFFLIEKMLDYQQMYKTYLCASSLFKQKLLHTNIIQAYRIWWDGVPDVVTLQDQVQLEFLMKQLRWDKMVIIIFLVALDTVQLCSGLTSPILECTQGTIAYLQLATCHIMDREELVAVTANVSEIGH
jgi:hypothetical protein